MSATVICPSCQEENSGSSLLCKKCQTSLIGITRQMSPLSESETASRQKEVMKNQIQLVEQKVRAENVLNGTTSNFYWIAGLSIINSIAHFAGGNIRFSIGLGITQVIDAISTVLVRDIGGNAATIIQSVAFMLDIFIAGIFIVFGIFARKQQKWAFLVGMTLYALDGIIFLIAKDFIGFGFHLFILFGLYTGFISVKKYKEAQQGIIAA